MGFDYSRAGAYFVTVTVDDQRHRFRDVVNELMVPNRAGEIVESCWLRLPARFSTLELDEFVVMPNHFHAIVILGESGERDVPSLSPVMQVFKSESTIAYGRGVKEGNFPPYERALWHRSFHDRIIRIADHLNLARDYVQDNPRRWHEAHLGIVG